MGTTKDPRTLSITKNKVYNDHAITRIQGRFRLVTQRYEWVGSQILPTLDQPRHGREAGLTTAVPDEPELRSMCKRGNRQTIKNRVHTTS